MDPGLYLVLGALATATATVLVALRRFSGTVSSSAATDLWKESSDIRTWSAEQIKLLQQQVNRLQSRVETIEGEADELRAKNAELRAENAALRVVNDELRKKGG